MKLKDFSELLGFTKTEASVLFFLIILFFAGFIIKLLNADKVQFTNYDYNLSDSLFLSASDQKKSPVLYSDNDVDYQKKDIELSKSFFKRNSISLPAEKSIDLNTATLNALMDLPGIGEKTADKIISLRKEKGGFKSIEEIKEVKGIGINKFERIKKYIFIEN